MGSFMNVLIIRVPKDLSVIRPGSKCMDCGQKIKFYDNIPVLSYIFLRGKCRYCKSNISIIYPLTEITTSLLFIFLYLKFGLSLLLLKYFIFAFLVLVISLTDIYTSFMDEFETGMIPLVYPFIGIITALIFSIIEGNFVNSLAGMAAGYLVLFIPATIYSYIRNREGMGEGDFILFAMIGGFTYVGSIPAILVLSSFLGILAGLIIIILTKNKEFPIPFAPMLGIAGILYLFYEKILNFSKIYINL